MNNTNSPKGFPGGPALRWLGAAVALGAAVPAKAYDYVTYSHTQPSAEMNWSVSYTLPGYAGAQTIAAILITYETYQETRFRFDNDDPSGYSVTSSLAGTMTLSIPGSGSPTLLNTTSASQIVPVASENGDAGSQDFGGPDGFDVLLTSTKSSVYSVPSGDFSIFSSLSLSCDPFLVAPGADPNAPFFVASPVSFTEVTSSASGLSGGPASPQTSLVSRATTTVTVQFVLVPEAEVGWAAGAVVVLAVGSWWRRRQA